MTTRQWIRLLLGIAFGVLAVLFVINGLDHGVRTKAGIIWVALGALFLARGIVETRSAFN